MDILIIGGNRFAGKIAATQLAEQHNVTLLNRTGTGPANCNYIKCNRRHYSTLKTKLSNSVYDVIIDMCCYNDTDIKGLIATGVVFNRYILMSTLLVMDDSVHGKEKLTAETYLLSRNKHISTIIRSGYILGENNPRKRIQYYTEMILNNENIDVYKNGNQPLYVTDVNDVVSVIVNAVNIEPTLTNITNVPGFNTTSNDIIKIINNGEYKHINYNQVNTPFDIPIQHMVSAQSNEKFVEMLAKLYKPIIINYHSNIL